MDWILGVMSIGVHPWRLVIGRLGRIGHGELKAWLSLLSRKSLAVASNTLKETCKQCSYLFPTMSPCILSACLVSMEPDSSFRMMPDMFTPDERFGQNSQNNLSTPQDGTCTHILVFPTSAIAQVCLLRNSFGIFSASGVLTPKSFPYWGNQCLFLLTNESTSNLKMGDM